MNKLIVVALVAVVIGSVGIFFVFPQLFSDIELTSSNSILEVKNVTIDRSFGRFHFEVYNNLEFSHLQKHSIMVQNMLVFDSDKNLLSEQIIHSIGMLLMDTKLEWSSYPMSFSEPIVNTTMTYPREPYYKSNQVYYVQVNGIEFENNTRVWSNMAKITTPKFEPIPIQETYRPPVDYIKVKNVEMWIYNGSTNDNIIRTSIQLETTKDLTYTHRGNEYNQSFEIGTIEMFDKSTGYKFVPSLPSRNKRTFYFNDPNDNLICTSMIMLRNGEDYLVRVGGVFASDREIYENNNDAFVWTELFEFKGNVETVLLP